MPEIILGKVVGPQGPKGDTGETGPQGIQGPKGDTGLPVLPEQKVTPEREDRKAFRVYRVKLVPLGLPVQREILAHRDHKVFKGNVEKKAILVLREKKVTQVLKVLRE